MRTLVEGDKVGGLLLDNLLRAQSKVGVILGGDISAGSGDAVNVRGGYCTRPGDRKLWRIGAATNLSLGSRHATYTKWGIVCVDTANNGANVSVTWGTAAANPVLPSITNSAYLPLAAIKLPQTAGGAFTIYDLIVPSPMHEDGFHEEFAYKDTTNTWTEFLDGGIATIYEGTIMALNSGNTTYSYLVSKIASYTVSLEWQNLVHVRARFKMNSTVDHIHIGLTSLAATPPMAATNGYVSFERGTSYWCLTNCNGSASSSVQSTVSTDDSWHTLDLLWLSDRTMVWFDGAFLLEHTAYVPSVSTAERVFLQADDTIYGASNLFVEYVQVVSDWW